MPNFTEEDKQKLDNAANDAENELIDIPEESIVLVANWVKKWYMKAGYKRLGRILIESAKEEKS